jgi:hypothetical protein
MDENRIHTIWLPYSRAQLIAADLESLLPHALTADLIPTPLNLWLDDYGLQWRHDAAPADIERLMIALQRIDEALHLSPGQSLRASILHALPNGATTALPIARDLIGPRPEPPAGGNSAHAFAPMYAAAGLSIPIPIGPWRHAPRTEEVAPDHSTLTQVLGIEWHNDVSTSVRERYRPGYWYAEPELAVLQSAAHLQIGAVYQSLAARTPWANAETARVTLADWSWAGPDMLDPVASTIAAAVWTVLSTDSSAAGEWWRSHDRAARLNASLRSGAHCIPASNSRLMLDPEAGNTAIMETLQLGWMPSARCLAGVDHATRMHWATTLATHPSSGMGHLAAAHHLVTLNGRAGTLPSDPR